uniref:Uncharacterized protein n=1 Tax=Rhizophora mucronata TaxID=61149 RepID=A0A2P2IPH9_RHIMU
MVAGNGFNLNWSPGIFLQSKELNGNDKMRDCYPAAAMQFPTKRLMEHQ